jgi:hypothetical protein
MDTCDTLVAIEEFEDALEEEGGRWTNVLRRHFRHGSQHTAVALFDDFFGFIRCQLGILRCVGVEHDRNLRRHYVVSNKLKDAYGIDHVNIRLAPVFQLYDSFWPDCSPCFMVLQPAVGTNTTTVMKAESSRRLAEVTLRTMFGSLPQEPQQKPDQQVLKKSKALWWRRPTPSNAAIMIWTK